MLWVLSNHMCATDRKVTFNKNGVHDFRECRNASTYIGRTPDHTLPETSTSAAVIRRRKGVTNMFAVSPGLWKQTAEWPCRIYDTVAINNGCSLRKVLRTRIKTPDERRHTTEKIEWVVQQWNQKNGPDVVMNNCFAGWWRGLCNVRCVWLWADTRTLKDVCVVVVFISFIHFNNVRKQRIKSMEEENIKQAACITNQLKRKRNVAWIVLLPKAMSAHCMNHLRIEVAWNELCKFTKRKWRTYSPGM